jgi:AraC-like DNA-binding protein
LEEFRLKTNLTTEHINEQERFSYWHDVIGDVFLQLDMSQLSSRSFSGQIETGFLENIQISTMMSDPYHGVRSVRQIKKSNEDSFFLCLQTSGQGYSEQDQRDTILQPGDFILYDSTRPYIFRSEQPFEQLIFKLPRSLLLSRCGQAELITSVRMPGTQHPVSSMVSTYLRTVASSYLHLDPVTQVRVSESTLDLLATALSTVSGIKLNEVTSTANVHLERARAFISTHLADPDLTPSLVADNLGISIRYLHKIFEVEGQSVSAMIRKQRLDQCRRDLSDPKQIKRTVMDIAFQWGFNDAAHFSRLFKRHFGMSPIEYRTSAL